MLIAQGGGKMISTIFEGLELDSLTSSAGYHQIIDKPMHVINNFMSCIDLIFCTNQSAILNHGVDLFLINVFTTLFMIKLAYMYLSLQYIPRVLGL